MPLYHLWQWNVIHVNPKRAIARVRASLRTPWTRKKLVFETDIVQGTADEPVPIFSAFGSRLRSVIAPLTMAYIKGAHEKREERSF